MGRDPPGDPMMVGNILAGLVCGVLSGFGIGGGSLLMVWMTAIMAMEQQAAQSINLLYFLPTAAAALIFHFKHKQVQLRSVIPVALTGCIAAIGSAMLSTAIGSGLLQKFFGVFLILVGISEICKKTSKE